VSNWPEMDEAEAEQNSAKDTGEALGTQALTGRNGRAKQSTCGSTSATRARHTQAIAKRNALYV